MRRSRLLLRVTFAWVRLVPIGGVRCGARTTAVIGQTDGVDTTSLTKDTRLCISLAARPGNTGTRFHNWLYRELGLDFVYKAFATDDIAGAVAGIRALGIRGAAVSMPFKQEVIPLLDSVEDSASAIGAVNTIVNTDGQLRGWNTDYVAVRQLLAQFDSRMTFAVLGSGGMARAVVAALRDAGFQSGTVVARNPSTGPALAAAFDYEWASALPPALPQLIINSTPVGMTGAPEADALPVPPSAVEQADAVFDVVGMPAETPLVLLARSLGKRVITGAQVMSLQAVEQFVLYTGVRPTPAQAREATRFSRAA